MADRGGRGPEASHVHPALSLVRRAEDCPVTIAQIVTITQMAHLPALQFRGRTDGVSQARVGMWAGLLLLDAPASL